MKTSACLMNLPISRMLVYCQCPRYLLRVTSIVLLWQCNLPWSRRLFAKKVPGRANSHLDSEELRQWHTWRTESISMTLTVSRLFLWVGWPFRRIHVLWGIVRVLSHTRRRYLQSAIRAFLPDIASTCNVPVRDTS